MHQNELIEPINKSNGIQIKITPLLLLALACLLIAGYTLFFPEPPGRYRSGVGMTWIMPALLAIMAGISLAVDYFIIKYSATLKKVWIIESILIFPMLFFVVF